MPKPPVRVVTFGPPTGRPFGTASIRNTEFKFLADEYADKDDIKKRWLLLKTRIENAGAFIRKNYPSDPVDTLKFFAGPEWFFRKKNIVQTDQQLNEDPNINLTYVPPYTRKEAITLLKTLLKESRQAPLNAWLIMPGTIYWGEPSNDGKWDTFNLAPVVYNGTLLSVVHKQGEADTWARHENWGNGLGNSNVLLNAAMANSNQIISQLNLSYTPDVRGLFECEGISFALEVCGDHSSGRLSNHVLNGVVTTQLNSNLGVSLSNKEIDGVSDLDQAFPYVNDNFVDVHVLISCGARLMTSMSIARKGGFFIQADGSVSADSAGSQTISERMYNYLYTIDEILNGKKISTQATNLSMPLQKKYFPQQTVDIYRRITIYNTLLNLNSPPVATAVTTTVTNS